MNKDYLSKLGVRTLAQLLIAPVGLLSVPLYTSYLSPENYGIYGMFFMIVNFIQPFIGLGLGTAYSKNFHRADTDEHRLDSYYSVFYFRLIIGVLLVPLLISSQDIIVNKFFSGNERIFNMLIFVFIFLPIEPLQNRFLRSSGRVNILSIFLVIETYVYLALSYILLRLFGTIDGLLFGISAARLLRVLIIQVYIVRLIGFRFGWNKEILISYINYGVVTVPMSIGAWVIDLSDRFFLAAKLDMTRVGYYQVAYALVFIPNFISSILGVILFEHYSKLRNQGKTIEANDLIRISADYAVMSTVWVICFLLVDGMDVLSVISNSDYANNVFWTMIVLVLAYFVKAYIGIVSQVLIYSGAKKHMLQLWNLGIIINLIINALFITYFGIIVAAFSTLIAYIITLLYLRYSLKKNALFIPKFRYKLDRIDILQILCLLGIFHWNYTDVLFYFCLLVFGISFVLKSRQILFDEYLKKI